MTRHNLHDLCVQIPQCVLTAVTGVSGSGKSTLVTATYTGMFDVVRKLFSATDEARARGWAPGRVSFNVADGRCPTC